MKPNKGFSKDPRIRGRQQKMLEVYAEQAPFIGGDRDRDREAMMTAVDRAGYMKTTRDQAKIALFMKLWKSDEARAYIHELWGLAVDAEPDPVSFAMRMLYTHAAQEDEEWGPRDRATSLAATREIVRIFVPAQTAKVATLNLSARVSRPAEFDTEPVMQSRTILPLGKRLPNQAPPWGRMRMTRKTTTMTKTEALAVFATALMRELLREDDAPAAQPKPRRRRKAVEDDPNPQPRFDFDESANVCEHGGVWIDRAQCPVHGPMADEGVSVQDLEDITSDEAPNAMRAHNAWRRNARLARAPNGSSPKNYP